MLSASADSRSAFLMPESSLHQYFIELLAEAGVTLGGNQAWDLQLK